MGNPFMDEVLGPLNPELLEADKQIETCGMGKGSDEVSAEIFKRMFGLSSDDVAAYAAKSTADMVAAFAQKVAEEIGEEGMRELDREEIEAMMENVIPDPIAALCIQWIDGFAVGMLVEQNRQRRG